MIKLLLFAMTIALHHKSGRTIETATESQLQKDLNQINYYNYLLHRHRTEKSKIEKLNQDIRDKRLKKLQVLMDTPLPNNVTLITNEESFPQISQSLHPANKKSLDEKREKLLLTKKSLVNKPGGKLVQFQLSEREYKKYGKFLQDKTIRRFIK